ncbi:MAG TPA: hypothetical protein GX400_19725 [Chloroflexi bacterium]|nr:hypothetical protein [Chloroflexota bacterium]
MMFDYGHVVFARQEYEARVRKVEQMLEARRQLGQLEAQPGYFSGALYRIGVWLETMGARLKAQHQPIAIRQTYSNGRAG